MQTSGISKIGKMRHLAVDLPQVSKQSMFIWEDNITLVLEDMLRVLIIRAATT